MPRLYVVRCGSKNGYHINMCLKKIELRAQIMITILRSLVNIIGEDLLMIARIFTLILTKIFIGAPKFMEK